jgi:hypothetical protein
MPPTYEATDPKTGQKWTWDGKKWNVVAKPTGVDKFGMDVATGMGLDSEKIRSAYKGGGTVGQVKEIGGEMFSGLKNYAGNVLKDPAHIIDPLNAMASGLTHGLGLPDKPGESFHTPVPGEVVGSAANILGGAEGAGKVSKVSGKAAVRDVLGVGEKDVESFTKKAATKEDAAHAKALEKVEKAKESYAGAVSDALKKRAEASAKETAAKVKQEALTSKHGPVYQRMNEMADTAREHVGKIEQKVNESEGKKWQEFSGRMENTPVKTDGVAEAIDHAQSNILTGESLPIFKQIMGEITAEDPLSQAAVFGGKGGVSMKEFLSKASPEVRERLKAQGFEEGGPEVVDVPLDVARRLYTKIGRKMGGGELPRDVSRALATVGESLDSSIAKSIAKKGGADALRDYRKLQADWKQYRQTFSDRDSPLRKIMEAKDPSTKLGPITGETGARAVDYLGRYRNMGAQPEQLGKIRALHKALKEVPSGGGKAPAMPERPSLPGVPAKKTLTPQAARESMLEGKGQFYSRPPSKWELMFPPLLAYKTTLKHLMQSPRFRKWLSSDNPSTPVP